MKHSETATAADGTTIAWSRRGAGSSVVLVHGITECAASLEPVAERLSANHDVITMDLRGHGESGTANRYDLEAMAGDVITVMEAASAVAPHLVGHSLGGIVVSAAAATIDVASTINIDQPLALAGFKELLQPAEPMLRDPNAYQIVLDGVFDSMYGELLSDSERDRVKALRRADQAVVLGVWELILSQPVEDIAATVDTALGGFADRTAPYLSLFGIDPGPDYPEWLAARIPTSTVDVWTDHGHYPHLVDPDRFVSTAEAFWAQH